MTGARVALAAAAHALLLAACASSAPGARGDAASREASFDAAVRGIIEADTLVDARVSLRQAGWKTGRAPGPPSPGAVVCPAPVEVWPLHRLYRTSPDLRADLFVLSFPWLTPADVRAVREKVRRQDVGPAVVAASYRSGEEQLATGRYEREGWQLTGLGETWTAELLVRPWPDGRGSFVIGACAPSTRWEAARAALLEVAGGLEPVERSGLDVAIERAQEVASAARTWRWMLPAADAQGRVAAARSAALAALDARPDLDRNARALATKATLVSLDARGVVGGNGYDAAAVVKLLRQASALDPTHGEASLLGRALLDAGEPSRALEVLHARVARLPRPDPRLLLALGDAQDAVGQRADAEATWRRAQKTLDEDIRIFHPAGGSFAADDHELRAVLDERLRR